LILLGAALLPVAALAAPRGDDDGAIRAAAKARLAEESGNAQVALDALADVASRAPASGDLPARILEQALLAGDQRRATDAASQLWLAGQQRFDARLILLVDAVRRADWRAARSYADAGGGKGGIDLTARLISPVALGWIDVATRTPSPERHLARFGRMGEDPTAQWIGATMVLLGGNSDAAAARAAPLSPSNRTSRIVAARLAASFVKRGENEPATAIESKLSAANRGEGKEFAGITPQPVADARQGMAQWFALLGDGFARTPGGSRDLALLLTRAANWIDPADAYGQLALAESLAAVQQQDAAISLLAKGASGRAVGNEFALRQAELVAADGKFGPALAAALPRGAKPPTDVDWLIRFANIARQSGDDAVAMQAFDLLLDAAGTGSDTASLRTGALIAKAELFMKADQWDQARPMLEAALAASPDDPSTLNFVGYSALERRDNVPQALARIEAAWSKDPANAAITDSLGWAYLLSGDAARAVPLLEMASRGEPGNAVISEHLGDALWKNGRHIEARYAWRIAALDATPVMAARLEAKLADGLTPATLAP
jgi:tetratricopeptide (TPR) repeat protein